MLPQTDVSLERFNTLALPGRAARYQRLSNRRTLPTASQPGERRFLLGGGSNLVLGGDFPGLVLHMAIPGHRLVSEDSTHWIVEAGAGENWHDFVQWTLMVGYPGLENLSLIPGTVGAAPIQNIGAYGLELAEVFHSAECWDFETQRFFTVDRDFCRFGYRDSRFKQEGWHLDGRVAIVSVQFRLAKDWQANTRYADLAQTLAGRGIENPDPLDIAAAVITLRQNKLPDPARLPNAGSFFHNPVVDAEFADRLKALHPLMPVYPQADGRCKLAAGWLIEQAGWKGRALGPVGMFERQALVLVNHGGATGADVVRTMQAVQVAVRERFAVNLTPEPVFL